ncbi:hypothetical protein Syun_003404 [Stephania yunnanensis]|uniref:Uncharacterized protein n=1 Tax=Stephania yunnanensis TaxID=152371 RepID=A0AAP0PZU0_9MAGN
MAVTFTDLHTESGLKSIIEFLSGCWCESWRPSFRIRGLEAALAEEDIQQPYGGVTYARLGGDLLGRPDTICTLVVDLAFCVAAYYKRDAMLA